MENQTARTSIDNNRIETYSDKYSREPRSNNADAAESQNAQYNSDNSGKTETENRTAQRWWLRKRIMSL